MTDYDLVIDQVIAMSDADRRFVLLFLAGYCSGGFEAALKELARHRDALERAESHAEPLAPQVRAITPERHR